MADKPDPIAAAKAAMDGKDPHAAFGHLRALLEYPGDVASTPRYSAVLEAFAPIAGALSSPALAAKVRAVAARPDNAKAAYDLGYQLMEVGLPGVAATVLARADRLDPGNVNIVAELAAALENAMRFGEVCAALQRNRALVERTFVLAYLLAFNAVMAGDVEEARRTLPLLRNLADAEQGWAAARIERYLARADAARGHTPLDDTDLRGWHFVLTGGLLLHLSPHGFHDGMRGRYAFVQDSEEMCLEGIRRLGLALEALGRRPERVLALADRSSAILAHAAANVLGLPIEPWPSDKPGLIVAYDLESIDGAVFESLQAHRPGQVLWGHASCWTSLQPIAADLVTFLYQHKRDPWGPQMRVNATTQETYQSEPAPGTPAEIGVRVAAAALEPDALADMDKVTAFARAVSPETAAGRADGERERQFPGSPVASSRFY